MKKSKIPVFVLVFVFAVSMMTACGNIDEGNAVASTITTSSINTVETQLAENLNRLNSLILH